MRRDRFEEIMRYLHFNSNERLDANDRHWKIRPLDTKLQSNFLKYFVPEQDLSHDKAMIKYFGRCSLKQAIRMKPIRLGSKYGV